MYPNLILKVLVVLVVRFIKLKIKSLKIQIGKKEKKGLNRKLQVEEHIPTMYW